MEHAQTLRDLVPIYPASHGHRDLHAQFLGYLLYSREKHAFLVASKKLDPARKNNWVAYAGAAHRFDNKVMAQTAQKLVKKGARIMELYEKDGRLMVRQAV